MATEDTTERLVVNLHDNGSITLIGTAWDIDRVQQACKVIMRRIEFDGLDPHATHTVIVPPPDPS